MTKPPHRIARGLFDSPTQLLSLAREREADLAMHLGWGDDGLWVRVFDFAIAINSLRDWVAAARPDLKEAVREFAQLPPIVAWKDIANAGKHVIMDYPTEVVELNASIQEYASYPTPDGGPTARRWNLKIVLRSGARAPMQEVAADAMALWEGFFAKHGIPA